MPDPKKGLLVEGNIDLYKRPVVHNSDGTISTVRSMSFTDNGREVLIPTVSDDGRILDDAGAIDHYRRTGRHLGIFDSPENADRYAESLHDQQAETYKGAENEVWDAKGATSGLPPVPTRTEEQNAAADAASREPLPRLGVADWFTHVLGLRKHKP